MPQHFRRALSEGVCDHRASGAGLHRTMCVTIGRHYTPSHAEKEGLVQAGFNAGPFAVWSRPPGPVLLGANRAQLHVAFGGPVGRKATRAHRQLIWLRLMLVGITES